VILKQLNTNENYPQYADFDRFYSIVAVSRRVVSYLQKEIFTFFLQIEMDFKTNSLIQPIIGKNH